MAAMSNRRRMARLFMIVSWNQEPGFRIRRVTSGRLNPALNTGADCGTAIYCRDEGKVKGWA
jgi:hypothetical protein